MPLRPKDGTSYDGTAALNTKASGQPADTVRWLAAVVERAQTGDGQNPAPQVVELPGGARLGISEVKQMSLAASLLRALKLVHLGVEEVI